MASAHITPEPDQDERKAILAALSGEAAEQPCCSAWADALLPTRDGEEDRAVT